VIDLVAAAHAVKSETMISYISSPLTFWMITILDNLKHDP
jgi:hypothetical protein